MHSLAKHPEVKSAGEYYCVDESRCTVEAWANKKAGDWNLTKTFYIEEPPVPGLTIFLHRRDKQAQYASYLKACQTGAWMHGMESSPVEPIANFVNKVEDTFQRVAHRCDLIIAYEDLIRDWEYEIDFIESIWGIERIALPMATTKQSS
jgi:hypothetical protein